MMLQHKELLHCIINSLNEFNFETEGVEDFISNFLTRQKSLSDEEKIFIQEVFSGCIRYDMAIMVVVDGYFRSELNRKTCLISDRSLYRVRKSEKKEDVLKKGRRLDELGAVHYRKFVMTQNITKMHKFLTYFFDETKLRSWLFAEWCHCYDHSYVQIHLLSPLIRWLPELQEILIAITDRINNKQRQRDIRSPTAIKPFNLTKPKPRSISVPEKIPKLKIHQPVPKSTYKQPEEFQLLNSAKESNKVKAEKRLIEASMNQFSCATTEKSEKTKQRINKYMVEENAKLEFNKSKAKPMPSTSGENVSIRLNVAAIMREGLLIQKKEEEEMQKLQDLATGGRDASEFLKWQHSMRQKDLDDKLADIEARRLDGKLSYEEAILARQTLIEENKQRVQDIKKETKEMMDQFLKEKFLREKEMRDLVEQVMEGHEHAKEAKFKLKKYKQSLVAQVNQESKELMRKAVEEAEAEMREKVALIAKIRAIESVPRIRFKYVDLTETAGAGLLGEMSVAELRERLNLLKIEQRNEEARKRNEILQSKVEKDQLLMDTLQSIATHRAEKGKQAAIKNEQKRHSSKPEIRSAKVEELQERLSAKRAEREKLRTHSSPPKLSLKQKQLTKQKATLEEQRWKELERTREKAVKLHAENIRQNSSRSNLFAT